MSFKPDVQADDTGKWYGNALCFATRGSRGAGRRPDDALDGCP
jgi:hypothetical protein